MEKLKEESRNIVVFNQNNPAGISTILKNIIRYSGNDEIPYRLVLYHFDTPHHHLIEEDWCEDVNRIKLCSYDNLFYSVKRLAKFVDKNSIIVANDIPELRMSVLLKLPNPLIYIIHGDFRTYYDHCEQYQDYIDLIIAYSAHIKSKLEKQLRPENCRKIKLIYYPIPEVNLPSSNKTSSSIDLVFVGSIIDRKGIDLLPCIVKGLEGLKVDYTLEIIGSGERDAWLHEQLCGNKRVVFKGQQSNAQVLKILSSKDVLLFPTRSEGLPNVLVEAMKAGCVPVVSDIPSGIPDVVTDSENGFLIPVEDVEGFVSKISVLSADRNMLRAMTKEAKLTANTMFNPHKNAHAYYNAFSKVIQKSTIPKIGIPTGPILNKPYLPNFLVKTIRKFNINPNL